MVENPFFKVKKFLENLLSLCQSDLDEITYQLDNSDFADGIKIVNHKTNETKIITFEIKNKTSKNIFKRFKANQDQKLIDSLKDKLEKEFKKQQSELIFYLNTIKETLSYFTDSGIKKVIPNIASFTIDILTIGGEINLSLDEIKIIIASSIKQKSTFYKNNLKAQRQNKDSQDLIQIEEMEESLKIDSYFSKTGEILPNDNVEQLEQSLNKIFYSQLLLINNSQLKESENSHTLDELIQSFIAELRIKNAIKKEDDKKILEESIKKQNQAKQRNQDLKNNKKAYNLQMQAITELKKYYQNNKIIKIHPDLEAFKELLEQCQLLPEQIEKIIRLMENKINQSDKNIEEKYSDFLTSEQIFIINYAQKKKLEKSEYILGEILSTLELMLTVIDAEEIIYLQECLQDNIKELTYILNLSNDEIHRLIYKN